MNLAVLRRSTAETSAQAPRLRPVDNANPPPRMTERQFFVALEQKAARLQSDRAMAILGEIQPAEIEDLVALVGRIQGRYVARLLEAGKADKPLGEAGFQEIRRLREQVEELQFGLTHIRQSAESGALRIRGLVAGA